MLHRQLPTLAGEILARLRAREPAGPALSGVLQAQDALTTAGFRPPSWEDLLDNPAPPSFLDLSGHLPSPAPGAGKRPLPLPLLSNSKLPYCHSLTPRPKRFCFRRLGLSAAALSAVCRPAPSSPSLLTTCVPFCCGVCASPCPCPRAAAGAVALSTLLATIEQPALGLVLCGVGDARSSERQLVFAGRRGPVSLVTHLCAI